MTEQELRKLNRTELLELLLEATRENELLRAQLAEANQKLADRTITAAKAGSIAQAALQLNGVFEAAQHAAEQYVENVKRLADERYRRSPQQSAPQQPAPARPASYPAAHQPAAASPYAASAARPAQAAYQQAASAGPYASSTYQQPAYQQAASHTQPAFRPQAAPAPTPAPAPSRQPGGHAAPAEDPYEAAARHYASRGGRP